ncbi:MAG: hypothetical protein QOI46_2104, partial [Alphaproteobacteria bacterium]|nr:hypothetical protein [Alphaproteobacteria bacterium]
HISVTALAHETLPINDEGTES